MQDWIRRRLIGTKPPRTFAEMRQSLREARYDPSAKPFWEVAAELSAEIPAEEKARLPHGGSVNYKHYLYGAPKVDVPENLK